MSSLDLPVDFYHHGRRGSVVVSEAKIEPNSVAAMPSIHFAATALLVFPAFTDVHTPSPADSPPLTGAFTRGAQAGGVGPTRGLGARPGHDAPLPDRRTRPDDDLHRPSARRWAGQEERRSA